MTSSEFKDALRREPFHPFRLHSGSGKTADILTPNLVVVSDTGRTAVALKPGSDGFGVIDLLLIERLGFGNGEPARKS